MSNFLPFDYNFCNFSKGPKREEHEPEIHAPGVKEHQNGQRDNQGSGDERMQGSGVVEQADQSGDEASKEDPYEDVEESSRLESGDEKE